MIKSDCEGQGVVVRSLLPSQTILVVRDAVTAPNPADAFGCLDAGILERSHALVVHRSGFHHVDDVETILRAATRVAHSEEVPLSV